VAGVAAAVVTMCVVGCQPSVRRFGAEWAGDAGGAAEVVVVYLGRVHLLKLAVVLGVWQVSQAALVGTWLADLPALGAALVPEWQVARQWC